MAGTKRTLRERDESGKAKVEQPVAKKPLLERFLDSVEDTAGDAWEAIIDRLDGDPDIPFSKDKEKRNAFTNFVINIFDELFDVLDGDDDSDCSCDPSDSDDEEEEVSSITEESDESLPSDALESDDPSSFDGESDEDDPDAEVSIKSDAEEIAESNSK